MCVISGRASDIQKSCLQEKKGNPLKDGKKNTENLMKTNTKNGTKFSENILKAE